MVAPTAGAVGALADEAAHEVGEVVGDEGADGRDAGEGDGGAQLGDGPRGNVDDVPWQVC